MFVKAGTMAGAVLGWGTAVVVALTGVLSFERENAVMMVALSVATVCSACLALQRHQRPLGSAFELGYEEGRRDAIRELTRRSNVTPIRAKMKAAGSEVVGVGGWAALVSDSTPSG